MFQRIIKSSISFFSSHSYKYSTTFEAMSEVANKFQLPSRYADSQKSVWVEYIQLALDYKPSVNLGQGFSDYPVPDHVTKSLAQVAGGENCLLHQYTRGFGHPRLIASLAKLYSQLIGRHINPQTEILVTAGAYEALYSAICGHVDIGDEVIIIEPFFDSYEPVVKQAGGIGRFIPLRYKPPTSNPDDAVSSKDWVLDRKELESLFNSKTKAIIINTPNNPTGKVFTLEELQLIADLCKKWNVLCISDEVYEWIVYKPNKHIRIATLPGMWERTITIGSAGKTFSVTGWKIGWAYGPASLLSNLQMIHQNAVYTCNTPVQEAIALSFEKELAQLDSDECYFNTLPLELESKRDYMAQFLNSIGMKPVIPEGGYFMIANWSALESQVDLDSEKDKFKDYRFTKWMTKNIGVQGIPPSAFYTEAHRNLAEYYVRYCFIKKDENLQRAAKILQDWKDGIHSE